MIEVPEAELQHAVETQHRCHASLAYVESVSEEFAGEVVWHGSVHVFDIDGHARAKRAYAWSSPIEGSNKRRFFVVLQIPPINTPSDAVRVAIVAENRSKQE